MAATAVQCGSCQSVVPAERFNLPDFAPCPQCGRALQVRVFPALFHKPSHAGPVAADVSDAACFYHSENRADVPCASCGRFLCAVCEVQLGGEVLCPGCIHAGVTSKKLVRLENRRILYDNVALTIAIAPALLVWPTVITAPMAIFIALRYWKAPSSIVKRTRIRSVFAIVLGVIQIAFWGALTYGILLMRGLVK